MASDWTVLKWLVALIILGTFVHLNRPVRRHRLRLAPIPSSRLQQQLLHQANVTPQIMAYLGPEDAVALSLTCRALYRTLIIPAMEDLRGQQSRRDALVQRIEKDVAHEWYYCHQCSKLHPIRLLRHPGWHGYREALSDRGCKRNKCFAFKFSYAQARCVMNRHLWGSPYGTPLSSLSFRYERPPISWMNWHGPEWTESWTPGIIHDELFLSGRRTLTYELGPDGNLKEIAYKFRLIVDNWVCNHVQIHLESNGVLSWMCTAPTGYHCVADTRTSQRDQGTPRTDPFLLCDATHGSCWACLTDFEASVKRHEETGGRPRWTITVTSYHQFGTCRSPDDLKWKDLLKCRTHRLRDFDIDYLGSVKERWDTSETGHGRDDCQQRSSRYLRGQWSVADEGRNLNGAIPEEGTISVKEKSRAPIRR